MFSASLPLPEKNAEGCCWFQQCMRALCVAKKVKGEREYRLAYRRSQAALFIFKGFHL